MTPEAQRIAIAEACGWRMEPDKYYHDGLAFIHLLFGRCNTSDLPDYLNDLNAMHEAEKVLTNEQHAHFRSFLFVTCKTWYPYPHRACVSAAAAQRAEAFLRTLGLWKK